MVWEAKVPSLARDKVDHRDIKSNRKEKRKNETKDEIYRGV